jgi:uncharacterized membrane protein YtjA (UPF0391 family)
MRLRPLDPRTKRIRRIGNAHERRKNNESNCGSTPLLLFMLNYAIIFLIVALIAGVLGFGVIAGTAATIAKVLFVIFLVLFLVSLLRRRG